jgi:hypothetical protein
MTNPTAKSHNPSRQTAHNPSHQTPTRSSTAHKLRWPARFLLGALAIGGPASLVGSAHAAEKVERPTTCEESCVLAFADSDGDGYSDAYELASGTDPLDAASRPTDADTARLLDEHELTRARFSVDGPVIITAANGFIYQVDLTAQPDGSELVTGTLVDPVTGRSFTHDQFGINAGAAGTDVKALADSFRSGMGDAGSPSKDLTPPTDKPSIQRPHDPSLAAEDTTGTTPSTEPNQDPGANPEDEPGTQPGDETVSGAPKIKTWCNTGDDCPKAPASTPTDPKNKPDPTLWQRFKCVLDPACIKAPSSSDSYTDPDANPGGGTGPVPPASPSTPPTDPKSTTAPKDYQPGRGPVTEGVPSTRSNNGVDPGVTDPNPDGDSGTASSTSVGTAPASPGTTPTAVGRSIAPIDPPNPNGGGMSDGGFHPGTTPGPLGSSDAAPAPLDIARPPR